LLTPGARERCNDFKKVSRIRLVKEDKAALIENQLIKLG
jgi:DNA-binding TFAR19-related protein (PDSD5 family)